MKTRFFAFIVLLSMVLGCKDDESPSNEIVLNERQIQVAAGSSVELEAMINLEGSDTMDIDWSVAESNIATVNSNGKVTGVSEGVTTVTASILEGTYTATCQVTVYKEPLTGFDFEDELILIKGSSQLLKKEFSPENASDKSVSWSSSSTNILTISESGVVAAKGVGEATITGTTNDGGYTASCNVTVVESMIPEMTGASEPSGEVAFSSSYDNSSYLGYKVFDSDSPNSTLWISEGGSFTSGTGAEWVSYTFDQAVSTNIYYVRPQASGLKREPLDFRLQGKNIDTGQFVDLDVRESIYFNGSGLTFTFDNGGNSYKTYRLYVTKTRGSDVVAIYSMKLGNVSE